MRAVLGNSRLAGDRPGSRTSTPPGIQVAEAGTRVCTEWETTHSQWGRFIWGTRRRRCCDRVTRTYCDRDGRNCENIVQYENCKDETEGAYIGFDTKATAG
jgi:hypothetical protein